jgi:hypothetical protein
MSFAADVSFFEEGDWSPAIAQLAQAQSKRMESFFIIKSSYFNSALTLMKFLFFNYRGKYGNFESEHQRDWWYHETI